MKRQVQSILRRLKRVGKELHSLWLHVEDVDSRELLERQGYKINSVVADLERFLSWLEESKDED